MYKFLVGNIWVTKKGKEFPIRKLSNTHIMNIINCLNGTGDSVIPNVYLGKNRNNWIELFNNELKRRKNG